MGAALSCWVRGARCASCRRRGRGSPWRAQQERKASDADAEARRSDLLGPRAKARADCSLPLAGTDSR
jgi:hypothetical protein